MSYYVAPALKQLTAEINVRMAPPTWPTVDVGDGAIGDTSHQARPSDHNPDYSANGIVRAVDIGIEGRDARAILNEVIGDPRVWYAIHKGKIYSRSYGWVARTYTGSNPHNHHIHVSLQGKNGISPALAYRLGHDTSPWFAPKVRTKGTLSLANVRSQFKRALGIEKGKVKPINGVRALQVALNDEYGLSLTADGVVGTKTVKAWKAHEAKHPGSGSQSVPDKKSLKALPLKVRLKG